MSLVGFMRISSLSKNKRNLPPSPPKLPIIGNFHQLGTIPRLSFRNLSNKYGPLMLLHIGNIPTLVVSSAIIAREIMKTHDLAFADRPSLTIPNILFYNSRDIAFSRYGENWRKLKSIVVLHLLSGTRVKSYQRVREEEMSVMVGAIAQSHGTLVDLSALLERLTSNVLCKVAFGRTYQGVGIINKIKECVHMLGTFSVGNYLSWLSWIDRLSGLELRARKLSIEIDNFLKGVVEERLSKKTLEDVQGESAQNFVDILCDIQEDNTNEFILHTTTLKAVLLDVLVAGFDTTLITLEWAISELIRHPNVMKELQQEMAGIAQGRSTISEEDLDKLKYHKAVIKETLRLHPPLPLLVSRESRQEVNLMGYVIPPGTQVVINAWAIGRDPMSWTQSDEFKPERFLNNSIDYKGLNFELLPFGSGRRGCPGIHFAVSVVELALANIVHKFDFALPNGVNAMDLDMSEENGITLRKKSPLLVIASPRF